MCTETFPKFLFMAGKEMIDANCCDFLTKNSWRYRDEFYIILHFIVVQADILLLFFQICPRCYARVSQEICWSRLHCRSTEYVQETDFSFFFFTTILQQSGVIIFYHLTYLILLPFAVFWIIQSPPSTVSGNSDSHALNSTVPITVLSNIFTHMHKESDISDSVS